MLSLQQTMVAKSQDLLQGLRSSKREERLSALKQVKNQIIGNKHKKQALQGCLPHVIELLASASGDAEVVVHSAVILGSFSVGSSGTSGLQQILDHPQGLQAVLDTLVQSEDGRVLEAAVRCLKLMCQAGRVPTAPLLQPQVLSKLVQLLSSCQAGGLSAAQQQQGLGLAEAAAVVLSKCCSTPEERRMLTEAGAVQAAAGLLAQHAQHAPARQQALQLLSGLFSPSNPLACAQLLQLPSALDQLTEQLRSSCTTTRLLAASCIAQLAATAAAHAMPSSPDAAAGPSSSGSQKRLRWSIKLRPDSGLASPQAGSTFTSRLLQSVGVDPSASDPSMLPIASFRPTPSFWATAPAPVPAGTAATADAAPIQRDEGWHAAAASSAGAGSRQFGGEGAGSVGAGASSSSPGVLRIGEEQLQALTAARRAALPVVLRMLPDPTAMHMAPATLAALIEDNEELQQAAVDADAVRQLCNILNQLPAPQQPQPQRPADGSAGAASSAQQQQVAVREGCLRSLGYLCMARDDARKVIMDAKVLPHIQAALEEAGSPGTRAAAALCVMALTRTVRTLRCAVLTPELAQALCKLLSDDHIKVQVNATAALCNLVLEFSSVKEVVMTLPVLDRLAANAVSPVPVLRMYSTWALRNLAHKRDAATKQAIMHALGWPRMRALLSDPDEAVQEQAVCMLRNMCMDAPEHISAAFEWGAGDLLAALEEKLDPSSSVPSQLRIHALYTIVNSLTGSESIKEQVMSSNLPALLLHHLRSSTESEVRLAAVWCLINLTWVPSSSAPATTTSAAAASSRGEGTAAVVAAAPADTTGDGGGSGAASATPGGLEARLRRLRALGAQDSLQALLADPSLDVRERARTALSQMRSSTAA